MAFPLAEEEEAYESGVPVLEMIVKLEKQMLAAAKNLNFEKAAELRDMIKKKRAKDLNIIAG
jgi:excinuclease ABC subunit B